MLFVLAYQTTAFTQDTGSRRSLVNLTQYVDPTIGTGAHGHVFMGANRPFGAVQLGPTQMSKGWDWCSGYHASDSLIIGFAHTHLSGTGIGDLGDILFMPLTGPARLTRGTAQDSRSGNASRFSHIDETARPGYYGVKLQRYGIRVELTATARVGLHRYTFPQSSDAHILIDLQEGIGVDWATDTYLAKLNDSTLVGYRYSSGWAERQRVYFAAVFSKPIQQVALYDDQTPVEGRSARGVAVKGVVSFGTQANERVAVKVGLSPVSTDNALANIRLELPHWNFERVVTDADAAWNTELNKVIVKTSDQARLRTFYTALYHTMMAPSVFNDANGDYRGTDGKVYANAPFTNLTTFSLWDTYRAAHPLFTLLQPQRVSDMVNTMLAIHEQQGKLPIWHLYGNETYTMPGNSAIPVVADACLKGLGSFDVNRAYEAMKASALLDERGLRFVRENGYIPADAEGESVAKGLEYAIDDWCIAQVARMLGRTDDDTYFRKRARNYQLYFDPRTRFMRGRVSDDTWRTPFSPFTSRHRQDDFAEGNAWQYTWSVPHDVEGLVDLLGGETRFNQKLDSLFTVQGSLGEESSADITGLIGQYAHGNEPSHHIAYLYGYTGQPGKTAEQVRYILDHLYSDKTDGLTGNEDVGQLSAWYIFSAMGFYPVNSANGAYVFGSPVFDEVTLSGAEGQTFRITIHNNGPANRYIQRMTLNGMAYTKAYLLHQNIVQGGELVIDMGPVAATDWGTQPQDRARSDYLTCCGPIRADLSLTLQADRRRSRVGEPVQITLRLRNGSPTPVPVQAIWEHRLPAGLTLVNGSGISETNGVLTGMVRKLIGHTDTTFQFGVRPLRAGTYQAAFQISSASVDDPDSKPGSGTGDGEDDAAMLDFRTQEPGGSVFASPNLNQTPLALPLSNQPTASTDVADLSLRMSASSQSPVLNEVVSYTLTVTNSGGRAVSGVQVKNLMPEQAVLVNTTGWLATGALLSRTLGSLDAGSSVQVLLQMRMTRSGQQMNQAQISVSSVRDPDSTPDNGYTNGEDDTARVSVRVRP